MRHARMLNEQLANYFAARREVEESYVRQLQRLTKRPAFSDPSCIPIEFRGVCERLVAEIAEVAHAHTALEQRIARECEGPLHAAPTSGAWSELRGQDDLLAPTVKEINSLESQLVKDQRKLENKPTPANQNRVAQTQGAMSRAKETWGKHAPTFILAYEHADYQRLRLIRDAVRRFARAQCDMGKEVYELSRKTGLTAQAYEAASELERFAGRPAPRTAPVSVASPAPDEGFSVPLPSAFIGRDAPAPSAPAPRRDSHIPSQTRGPDPRTSRLLDERAFSRMSMADGGAVPKQAAPSVAAPVSSPVPPSLPPSAPPAVPLPMPSIAPISSPPVPAPTPLTAPPAQPSATEPAAAMSSRPFHDPSAPPLHSPDASDTNRAVWRQTVHIADAPLPGSSEDTEAMERVREKLRESSMSDTPSQRRREYRNTSYEPFSGVIHAEPQEIGSGTPWHSATPPPATPHSVVSDAPTQIVHPATPVSVHIRERVNAMWSGSQLTKVLVVGDLCLQMHGLVPTTPGMSKPLLRLQGAASLARTQASTFLTQQEPGVYAVDVSALARLPSSSDGILALQYQVAVDDDTARYVPLILESQWRCEPQQSSVLLAYRASGLAPGALHNMSFSLTLPQDEQVTGGVLSHPVGEWEPDQQTLHWTCEPLAPNATAPVRLVARFPLGAQGSPQPVMASWTLDGMTLSNVDVSLENGFALGEVTRRTVAGRYFAQN